MNEVLSERLTHLIAQLEPDQDVNTVLEQLLENELIRRLSRYQLTDRTLRSKYQLSFEQFKSQQVVERQGYSFEVESDSWDWEMALDGIETVEALLTELREAAHERQ